MGKFRVLAPARALGKARVQAPAPGPCLKVSGEQSLNFLQV